MNSIIARAHAKINLTLDVFNKRSDGYHSLASVMQTISLHDTLSITKSNEADIRFACDGDHARGVPTDETNIVVRAARSVLDVAGSTEGLDIHLQKRIPSQAGLGGGSSDAAAAITAITTLFAFDIGPKLAHDLAASLGSDVPFFLSGGTAIVRGRGDNICPVADCPPFWLVVVKPEDNVPTASAYGWLDEIDARSSNRSTKLMENAIKEGEIGRVIECQSNDFELPIFLRCPTLAWLRDELLMAGASAAHLCGSGAAVYGVAESENAARRIAGLLKPRYPHAYVACTTSRVESNPLRECNS